MADYTQLVEMILGGMRSYVQRNLQPLVDRVKVIEARIPERGEKGERGEAGAPGQDGVAGPAGADGQPGMPGPAGEKGDQGEPGTVGAQGEKGDRGEKGEPGERGERGEKGERGEAGPAGEKGADGVAGKDGAPGPAGDRGEKGERGEAGEEGRDAAQIEVLDGIDPLRRYQRGTYASHRGGLLRARRATDLLPEDGDLEKAGWQTILRGIDSVSLEAGDDLRSISLALRMTDGNTITKAVTVPVVVDRGIFKAGENYERGDGATWDGSFWIAQRKTADDERPGDASGAWRLAVKRGRDGRDGLKGEKGERGAEGRAGKDMTQLGPDGRRY